MPTIRQWHESLIQDKGLVKKQFDKVLAGKIVLAHFMESLDYCRRLEVMELEGDLHKAIAGGNMEKARKYMKRMAGAKISLAEAEYKN